MFFEIVNASDSTFTFEKTENFLKQILRNANKRTKCGLLRKSAKKCRPSAEKREQCLAQTMDNIDEINIEYLEFAEENESDEDAS